MKGWHKSIIIIILLILALFLIKTDKTIGKKKENITEENFENKSTPEKNLTKEDPEFWIEKLEHRDLLLMDELEITQFNQMNFSKEDFLTDLTIHEPTINKSNLTTLITSLSKIPNETRYDSKGNIMDKDFFNNLLLNINLDSIEELTSIKYGVTINRTMMRTFPTYEPSYKRKDEIQFDRFMETAIYPWEPLIIYSESKDGEWYFTRMYNYIGWVPREDVAIGDKEDIFNYINKEEFLVVIDKQTYIDNILFDMGVSIPLVKEKENSYIILLPLKDENGKLKVQEKEIDISKTFNKGYLPYTKENIIRQGFKFNEEEYGWGGMNNKRDCSAFIMDIYRTFGLKLPRNTSEQGLKSIGKIYEFNNAENFIPAIVLYMPGHTMLYLGEDGGEHYMIHQFAGYYVKEGDKLNYIETMKTAVTPINIRTSTGETYIDKVYLGKEFIKD